MSTPLTGPLQTDTIDFRVDTLLILGSGLDRIFSPGETEDVVKGSNRGVAGHSGRVARWTFGGRTVLVSFGRRHLYEGWSPARIPEIVRIAALHGADSMIVTNAAGGLDPRCAAGDLMLIDDILPFSIATRFLRHDSDRRDLRGAPLFAHRLYSMVEESSARRGVRLHRGVYAAVTGPQYETRAEIRMLRRVDCAAVGMSTFAEAVAAREFALRTIGLSLITNCASEHPVGTIDHADVLKTGGMRGASVRIVVEEALRALEAATN